MTATSTPADRLREAASILRGVVEAANPLDAWTVIVGGAAARLLDNAAKRWDDETATDTPECPNCVDGWCNGHAEITYHSGGKNGIGCEGDLLWNGRKPDPGPDYGGDICHCFDDVLAVADAILSQASRDTRKEETRGA